MTKPCDPGSSIEEIASRRALLERAGLLVLTGGAVLLAGCESQSAAESSEVAGLEESLTGNSSVLWCDNINEQLALVGGTGSMVCVRRGWSVPGDGGGGAFVWTSDRSTLQSIDRLVFNSAGAIVAGGGVVVIPTAGSRTGCWRRLFSGALDVRWFGARGDGSVDCVAAIQASIDAASLLSVLVTPCPVQGSPCQISPPPPNLSVYVPSGRYRVGSKRLVVRSNTTITGDGSASILFSPALNDMPDHTGMPDHMLVIPCNTDRIRISNIAFAGLNGVATAYKQDELFQKCAIHLDVQNEEGGTGFTTDVVIERCHFSNLFGFIVNGLDSLDHFRIRFSDNYAQYCGNGVNTCASNAVITNNILYSSEGIETSGFNVLVANNMISGYHASISVGGNTAPPPNSNISVIGNVLDATEANADNPAQNAAIVVAGMTDVTITGNSILNPPQYGVVVMRSAFSTMAGQNTARRVSISGNTIRTSSDRSGVSQLILVEFGSTDVSIVGNTLYGGSSPATSTICGITISDAQRVNVASNVIVGCNHTSIDLSNCSEVLLSGNQISGHNQMGIYATTTTNLTMIANYATQPVQASVWDLYLESSVTNIRLISNIMSRVQVPSTLITNIL